MKVHPVHAERRDRQHAGATGLQASPALGAKGLDRLGGESVPTAGQGTSALAYSRLSRWAHRRAVWGLRWMQAKSTGPMTGGKLTSTYPEGSLGTDTSAGHRWDGGEKRRAQQRCPRKQCLQGSHLSL